MVVLASGDPNFYGVAPLVVKVLGAEQVVIHPNVTAVQAACARLKISWQDAARGQPPRPRLGAPGRGPGPGAAKLIIYTDPEHTPGAIARFLLERGRAQARLCVLEDLGQATERVTRLTPEEAAGPGIFALESGGGPGCPGRETASPGRRPLHLGLPEEALAHEAGLITKSEVRAVVLAKLAFPGQVLWDVGAGCGSVGLEASLLLPGRQDFRGGAGPGAGRPDRRQPGKVRGAQPGSGLRPGPGVPGALPDPHRVFVGGGGRDVGAILQEVPAAPGRRGPGGPHRRPAGDPGDGPAHPGRRPAGRWRWSTSR